MWIPTNHIYKVNLFIVEFITSNSNSNRISLPIYTDFIQYKTEKTKEKKKPKTKKNSNLEIPNQNANEVKRKTKTKNKGQTGINWF